MCNFPILLLCYVVQMNILNFFFFLFKYIFYIFLNNIFYNHLNDPIFSHQFKYYKYYTSILYLELILFCVKKPLIGIYKIFKLIVKYIPKQFYQ